MNKKSIEVIFHIGLERTGTTSIQKLCTRKSGTLRASGILYPTRSLGFRRFNHGPLASAYLASTRPDDIYLPPGGAHRRELLRSLFEEIDASGARTVILSSEYFSSRFGPEEIARLASDFEDYSCRVCVVLRDHVTRFVSSYATHVVSGSQLAFDDYAKFTLDPASPQLRYRMIVERWRAGFGSNAVTVLDYAGHDDAVARFFAAFELPQLAPPARHFRYNRSLDAVGTEALRRINVELGIDHDAPSSDYIVEPALRLMLKWCARAFRRPSADWMLSRTYQESLDQVMRADLAWLSEQCGVAMKAAPNGSLITNHVALATRDRAAERLMKRLKWLWKPYAVAMALRRRASAAIEAQGLVESEPVPVTARPSTAHQRVAYPRPR